jgi:hypothetical protein
LNAEEIITIADQEGTAGVQQALGLSARQAEQVTVAARRAHRQGRDLDPNEIPVGSVSVSQARTAGVPTVEPAPYDQQAEAQARSRRIAKLPPSERMRAEVEEMTRQAIFKKNVENGYPEWLPFIIREDAS